MALERSGGGGRELLTGQGSAGVACDELSCRELVELGENYFGLRLPPAEEVRFERHLEGCGACRAYLKQVCRTIGTVAELRAGAVSPDVRAKLLAALQVSRLA